ncbi:MAG: TIGR01777 family protein [Candidatus Tectomicrobia bacterium]|nr:TIGR01777 family protein [Candidatus Tectomicrobia bacterium]
MKVAVSGSTGLIGSALVPLLARAGDEVVRLVRGQAKAPAEVAWDPGAGSVDTAGLAGVEGVVHLAGESIGEGKWTPQKKERIKASRVQGTRLLSEALARLEPRPRVLVCASAIGYYGDRGEETMTEASPAGRGFLAEVSQAWEAAAQAALQAGLRVVHLRFGFVLSAAGGAFPRMLLPFKMGVGGVIGPGKQYVSWISIDDAVRVIQHALTTHALRGPVNAVAPQPVTNAEFTKTLGRVLSRPTFFPLPAFAVRLMFGEMADALLLASTRVEPARLLATGYAFRHPDLEEALRDLLKK